MGLVLISINIKARFGRARVISIVVEKDSRDVKKEIITPLFFPSISSVYQNFKRALQWVLRVRPPHVLISAYDYYYFYRRSFKEKIVNLSDSSTLTLDSGGYELRNVSQNLKKPWTLEKYIEVIKEINPDFMITFDHPEDDNPIVSYEELCSNFSEDSLVAFVIHASKPSNILDEVKMVLRNHYPRIIAVPEISLGESLAERLEMVKNMTKILQSQSDPILLHLLGCGDPLAIKKYSMVGVDIFDGTTPFRRLIDQNLEKTLDFSQFSTLASKCHCMGCSNVNFTCAERVYAHNLLAYSKLMSNLQSTILEGSEVI